MKKYLLTIIVPFINLDRDLLKLIKESDNISEAQNIEFIFLNDNKKKIKKEKFGILKNISFRNVNIGKGPGIPRNNGLKIAKGKWILFLDSDDNIFIEKILKKKKYLQKCENNLVAFDYIANEKNFKKNKKKFFLTFSNYSIKKKLKNFFYLDLHYPIIFYFFNRKFLIKNNIRFTQGYYEDILFLLKVIFSNKKKISFLQEVIYKKNKKEKSITSTFTIKHINDYIKVWLKCANLLNKKYYDTFFSRKLIQVAFRGVLGYLLFNLRKNRKLSLLRKNNKIFDKLIKNINPDFKPKLKYDKIAHVYLNRKINEKI